LHKIGRIAVTLTIAGSIVAGARGWTTPAADDGAKLAERYCQTCHVLPTPRDLDKPTWIAKVFPLMRRYMGMDPIPNIEKMPHDVQALLPTFPAMTEDEWFQIAQWYLDAAPESFEEAAPLNTKGISPTFRAEPIDLGINPPLTSLVKYDAVRKRLVIGDGLNKRLLFLDDAKRVVDSITFTGPPSCIAERNGSWFVTDMGEFFPHDTAIGALRRIDWVNGSAKATDVIAPLRRPVHVAIADLNGDKRDDYLICEFGNIKGNFGWYEVDKKGKTTYHELLGNPGAISSVVTDLNNDNRPDIVVLMAQAREGVFAFINKGRGDFDPMPLLTFPPSYGSSSFQVVDLNGDPYPDLIVTMGDNGDYEEPPYKPYHGTYFYHGTKELEFTQVRFMPMYGAYGALYKDFDLDGTKDLLSFAFFPQLSYGDAGLIQYRPDVLRSSTLFSIDKAVTGRWLVNDVADIDSDGDVDIILGNFSMGPWYLTGPIRDFWTTGGRAAIVLRNQTRP
jgi:hypothetical protein